MSESERLEWEAFVATPAPRSLTRRLKRVRLRGSSSNVLIIFGSCFGGFGAIISALFLPWHLPKESKLDTGPHATTSGEILQTEPTNLKINRSRVHSHLVRYSVNGTPYTCTGFTTGNTVKANHPVRVKYLTNDPTHARPDGMRMGKSEAWGLLTLLFPAIGLSIAGGAWIRRSRLFRLLQNGTLGSARIVSIDPTLVHTDQGPVHKITLESPHLTTPVHVKSSDPALVEDLKRIRSHDGTIPILYDPLKPQRVTLTNP